MKKLIFVLSSLTQLLVAQTTEPTAATSKERKIALGISFSPDYSYRDVRATNSYFEPLVDLMDSNELPVFGLTTGLKLSTILKKRFTYETGVLFSKKGFRSKTQTFYAYDPNDPSIPKTSTDYYSYYSLDVPLKVNFYPIKTKTGGFSVSAGLITNLFFRRVTTFEYEFNNKPNQTVKQASNKFGILPSMLVAIGYQQELSERLFLKAEPSYRRALVNYSGNGSAVNTYLYSLGLDVSLFLKL